MIPYQWRETHEAGNDRVRTSGGEDRGPVRGVRPTAGVGNRPRIPRSEYGEGRSSGLGARAREQPRADRPVAREGTRCRGGQRVGCGDRRGGHRRGARRDRQRAGPRDRRVPRRRRAGWRHRVGRGSGVGETPQAHLHGAGVRNGDSPRFGRGRYLHAQRRAVVPDVRPRGGQPARVRQRRVAQDGRECLLGLRGDQRRDRHAVRHSVRCG